MASQVRRRSDHLRARCDPRSRPVTRKPFHGNSADTVAHVRLARDLRIARQAIHKVKTRAMRALDAYVHTITNMANVPDTWRNNEMREYHRLLLAHAFGDATPDEDVGIAGRSVTSTSRPRKAWWTSRIA